MYLLYMYALKLPQNGTLIFIKRERGERLTFVVGFPIMDMMSPIFSLDQIDELFHFSSIPLCIQEQSTIDEKTLPPLTTPRDCDVSVKPDHGKRRNLSVVTCGGDSEDGGTGTLKKKKIIHRDVERQRRQEMAVLYKSLRSQLPNEYLKGKRSISDHMHEAVKYVRHLQKKIEGLSERRDEIKRSLDHHGSVSLGVKHGLTVTVETSRSGGVVQVLVSSISNGGGGGGVPASRVLNSLIKEGLNVVSCISTNNNGRLHHCIQCCEVSEGRSVDDSELKQKLLTSIAG